ncbi:hypothetical protein ABT095_03490 [Kitasatospora sp. NPDC002227]|uniref:hypothetical protein n=1 Tax=Kitasatospora sp. NPDC002227 TaxID=3154773 RepID=UPI00332B73C4
MSNPQVFDRHEDVLAALTDPALVPPPATDGPAGSVQWLRARVSRFATGEPHARRRALIEADLARLDPAALRAAAARGFEPDARLRTVHVLAEALGLPEPSGIAHAVATVAGAYFTDTPADPAADAAVAWLLPRTAAGTDEELAANRIALLVQACDATATLVANARAAAAAPAPGPERPAGARGPAAPGDPDGGFGEVLRADPPVRLIRRVAARDTVVGGVRLAAGAEVVLDLPAAQRGHGVAVASGVAVPGGRAVGLGGDLRSDPVVRPGDGVADAFGDPVAGGAGLRPGLSVLTFGAGPRACPGQAQALAIAAGILRGASDPGAEGGPETDRQAPAELVPQAVERVLALAATWTAWDGRPVTTDGRTYAPHKAVRRVADHLIDHLAEIDARLAGAPTEPDHWHASATTTPADLAPFTPADLDETRSRLTRLARLWQHRLATLPPDLLDASPGAGWTFRQLAAHAAESVYYAEAVGDLSRTEQS